MYKKLSDWQQDRQKERGLLDTKNRHGVDATVWKQPAESEGGSNERPSIAQAPKAPPAMSPEDAVVELSKLKAEVMELNETLQLSEARYTGRAPGAPLRGDEYQRLLRRKSELGRRRLWLESLLSVARAARRSTAKAEDALKAETRKATIAETFMDLAKEMLAHDVYQRVLIASVHRHRDKIESAAS
jgi:hypothetical protein